MRGYAIAAVLLLWAGSLWWCGHSAFTAGANSVTAADAATTHQVRQATDRAQTDAAAASNTMHLQFELKLPALEVRTDDTRNRIRTIYLAQPAAVVAECRRPDGVQAELDAAVDRANAAARGDVRQDPPAETPAQGAGAP